MEDLLWLRQSGLEGKVLRHASSEKPVFGICGGYQMLGEEIRDPEGKFLAYINPVYRGEHRSGCKTFGEAVKGWQKHREKKV